MDLCSQFQNELHIKLMQLLRGKLFWLSFMWSAQPVPKGSRVSWNLVSFHLIGRGSSWDLDFRLNLWRICSLCCFSLKGARDGCLISHIIKPWRFCLLVFFLWQMSVSGAFTSLPGATRRERHFGKNMAHKTNPDFLDSRGFAFLDYHGFARN